MKYGHQYCKSKFLSATDLCKRESRMIKLYVKIVPNKQRPFVLFYPYSQDSVCLFIADDIAIKATDLLSKPVECKGLSIARGEASAQITYKVYNLL